MKKFACWLFGHNLAWRNWGGTRYSPSRGKVVSCGSYYCKRCGVFGDNIYEPNLYHRTVSRRIAALRNRLFFWWWRMEYRLSGRKEREREELRLLSENFDAWYRGEWERPSLRPPA